MAVWVASKEFAGSWCQPDSIFDYQEEGVDEEVHGESGEDMAGVCVVPDKDLYLCGLI